jgi:mannosyltransferase OCH1-like enzyme
MNNLYKTKDLAESAVLLTSGCTFVSMTKIERVCWFTFSDKKRCEELSNQFFFGRLEVNARDYYLAVLQLKNRIFASE